MVLPVGNKNTAETPGQAPAQAPAEGANGQGYVTREELAQFQEGLKETLSGWYQGMQSQTDRYQAKVQQRIEELTRGAEVLRASGVEVTDAQLEAAKNKMVVETFAKAEEAPPQQPEQAEEGDPYLEAYQNTVTASAERLMKIAGIEIEDDDPEVAIIEKVASGTVEQYLDAVSAAIAAKKERIAQGPPVGQMPSLSRGGTPASNDIQNIMNPAELWEIAVKQGRIK